MVDLNNPDEWLPIRNQLLSMEGLVSPWQELTKQSTSWQSIRDFDFRSYYETNIQPFVDEDNTYSPSAPALTGIVATQRKTGDPYVFINNYWESQGGTLNRDALIRAIEYSASLPLLFSTDPEPDLGPMIDGGVNKYNIRCPNKLPEQILNHQNGGIVLCIEPLSDFAPGVTHEELAEQGSTVHRIRISLHERNPAYKRIKPLYWFQPELYEKGYTYGYEASDMIRQLL